MEKKRQFTWEELSLLNKEDNAHVAVRGKVYDVSKFLNRHPGGKDMLLMGAGRDVTIVFETYHAFSDSVQKVLEKYYVGELISDELPTFPERGDVIVSNSCNTERTVKFVLHNALKEVKVCTCTFCLYKANNQKNCRL
ncbi:acyl-lipid (8-3)-desaturase-like [Orbicella faveolata]|uniref:acyl-lipid (8-3)-desaturase-like n=1 Tax=Orbicella faveolata TaxID=48498 RepID=UPI0009E2E57B|nr:acyl-lipid (8-3)-desaturase-like [Orbicella faveolata]XP_020625489.1 acyl-lipid (8-3)-desaturase-like [Orbicella faveolata]